MMLSGQHNSILNDKRGMAALLTVVMISAAVLIMAFSVSFLSIGELGAGYTAQKGEEALALAHGCAEESLRRIGISNIWQGGTLNLSNGSCIISLVGQGKDRTINITSTVGNYQKNLKILAKIENGIIAVNSWQEVSN